MFTLTFLGWSEGDKSGFLGCTNSSYYSTDMLASYGSGQHCSYDIYRAHTRME